MKKILYIITHLEMGGAQKHLLSLIRDLDRTKFDISLYYGESGALEEEFRNISGVKVVKDRFLIREINPFFDMISWSRMFFFMLKAKFDIVHTHSPKASVLGRWAAFFAGVNNVIYTVHGWPFHINMPKLLFLLFVFIEKASAKITKIIIVVSRHDLLQAQKYRIAPPSKIHLIHYGIPVERYRRLSLLRKTEMFFPLIIAVSSLKKQKGLFDFIDVSKIILRYFPASRFLIIGDGPLRRHILKRIKSAGMYNRIVITGWLKDLRPLYQQASLFMLTSYWEGLPLALIEALFCGIPAVVTDTGGVNDVVKTNCGTYIVAPGDKKSLANKAIYILRNYTHFSKIAKENSLALNSSYWSEERQQREIEFLYNKLDDCKTPNSF